MARKIRVEYDGAYYHVLNRGNFRSWIFEDTGTRKSFRKCLREVCEAKGWRLHAWVLMGNHYHLCLETPEPNLVAGMKWLQGTFSNRFNRYRKTNGHVFQGRYKAILLDGDSVGTVCHYIHLNPVRAGLAGAGALQEYADSSFAHLWYPRKRWSFEEFDEALDSAGGLKDKPKGRKLYRDYLGWLCEEEGERKKLGFESMSRGWAKGTKEFKKAVTEDLKDEKLRKIAESEAAEMREPLWQRSLESVLEELGKERSALSQERKCADWKVEAALRLRQRHLVPYSWIAENLQMGAISTVQSQVSLRRKRN